MISDEDKQRYMECTNCKDCAGWLKHCKAECCKIVFIKVDPSELENGGAYLTIKPKTLLSPNDQRYYKYRGIQCIRGLIRVPKDKIVVVGRKVMYISNCIQLENNLCKIHDKGKPEICQALTLETAKLPSQPFELTDNCLFKYKSREVKQDG